MVELFTVRRTYFTSGFWGCFLIPQKQPDKLCFPTGRWKIVVTEGQQETDLYLEVRMFRAPPIKPIWVYEYDLIIVETPPPSSAPLSTTTEYVNTSP